MVLSERHAIFTAQMLNLFLDFNGLICPVWKPKTPSILLFFFQLPFAGPF